MGWTWPALLVLSSAAPAGAATVEVCSSCAFSTIQAAVIFASSGDTVLVHPGTYVENVSVSKALAITSTDGSGSTTLQGVSGASSATLTISGEATGITVEGFAVVNPRGSRGAVVRGAATLRDLAFAPGSTTPASVDGYGLYVEGTAVVEDSSFSGFDTSGDGGCAWVEGTLEATRTSFEDCSAGSGGALYATEATVELHECTFARSAAAGGPGGTIFAVDTRLTLEGCTLEEGTATGSGGHLYALRGELLAIAESRLSGGEAAAGGGVNAVAVDEVLLEGNTWEDSEARDEYSGVGGHVALSGCASASIVADAFTAGEAAREGGSVWADSGDLSLHGVAVSGSSAALGGGLYWHGLSDERSTLDLVSCHFEGNSADEGGAVHAAYRSPSDLVPYDLSVEDSTFASNDALAGGALHLSSPGSVTLLRTTFCENSSRTDGGAVWVSEPPVGGPGTLGVSNGLFMGNVASSRGADLFLSDLDATVFASTFLASEAGADGAVYASAASLDFRNNLLAHVVGGAGLYGQGGSYTVLHDAWWLNDVDSGGDLSDLSGEPTLVFEADPRFFAQPEGWACAAPRLHPEGATWDVGVPTLDDEDGSTSDLGVHGGPLADPALWVDEDADGWAWIFDCDDDDPGRAPYLDEHCDGVDEDCDDAVDEEPVDPATWYRDQDGDGFGDAAATMDGCEPTAGWVADATDCDDTRDDAHPGGEEVWYDGVDQDCDGASDYDLDGDGFDAEDFGGDDCDDGNPGVSPGAEEVPGNGRDEDCDGQDGPRPTEDDGCGCASTAPGGFWPLGLVVLLWRRARRSSCHSLRTPVLFSDRRRE